MAAAIRLPWLAAIGGVFAVDSALKFASRRIARRLCAERQGHIAAAKDRFVARVAAIAGADAWDEEAYAKAVEEFSAARAEERADWDSRRAIAAHLRAKAAREAAWKLWVEEFAGEVRQLLGCYTVLSDFKTPSLKVLGMELGSLRDTMDLKRRLREGRIGAEELERILRLPPAPGERRRRRGAPIRRLCRASVSPPPDAEALLSAWEATRGHCKVAEKIRLGSLLRDAEASVDSSLIRDKDGEIVGRRPGLKGWLEAHCRTLLPHYATLMRYRRLAAAFREEHGLRDPVPAAALVEGDWRGKTPESWREQIDEARRRAAKLLEGDRAKTEKALTIELAERKERREEIEEATREAIRTALRRRRREADGMTA